MYQSGTLGGSGFASKFFSGWTIAPIFEMASGRPFNIITGDDRNFDFSTPTDRPNTAAAGATEQLRRYRGRHQSSRPRDT